MQGPTGVGDGDGAGGVGVGVGPGAGAGEGDPTHCALNSQRNHKGPDHGPLRAMWKH